jgi:hypothetical protein
MCFQQLLQHTVEFCVECIVVEKPEGRRQRGIPGRRWKDNIRMYLKQ